MNRVVTALAVLGVLLLAACSSDPPPTALPEGTATATPEATLDPHDAMLRFAQCMRDHGVDVPDPVDGHLTVDGSGVTQAQMDAARSACAKWQQLMEPQDGGRPLTEEQKQAFLDQAQCMRDRGWNVSDPVFDGGRVSQRVHAGPTSAPGDPKPGDPQFEKDLKACADAAGVQPPKDGG
ncbi:hypothetical protein [Cellulomonas sp. URHD0024]|uniref:hypothetical protein n=1 Tax=Cellulomonas sp. URHD0024 TaxID=1302620 RepID=UPI0003FFEE44|nr:hypothetical protein [Cellulomonas sp. URHD0024]